MKLIRTLPFLMLITLSGFFACPSALPVTARLVLQRNVEEAVA